MLFGCERAYLKSNNDRENSKAVRATSIGSERSNSMYNPIRMMAQIWKESDAEDRKDYIEGFIGFVSLFAICFMLGGIYV